MDAQTLQVEIRGKLQRMMDGIETVKERQEEMAADVSKIKEAVYTRIGDFANVLINKADHFDLYGVIVD